MERDQAPGNDVLGVTPPRSVIAAFDFDVTMTTRDAFVPFLYRAFGKRKVRLACIKLAPEAIKVVFGITSRDRFKERIIRELFFGESVDRLREVGRVHALEILGWIRPTARDRVEWHRRQKHRLVMVSASLGLYLEHVVTELGFDDLLCTNPSINHLVFDGGLVGRNCRGPEKVARLQALLGNISAYELYAYGDSAGDSEMLEVANHPNYRVFEH